jgi:hypothetical protein
MVQPIHGADGFVFVVADVNDPHGNLVAFVVNVGLWAVEKDAAPLRADGFGGDGAHLHLRLRISTPALGERRNNLGDG